MKRIAEWFAAVGAAAGRKGKRLVAIVAAVAMLGGVAGVSATAMADDGNASTTQSQTTDEKAAASAPAPLSTEGTNGVPDDPTLSAPAREKTVTANEDGTYTVALNVTGAKSAGTGEIVTNQPLDIVLVLGWGLRTFSWRPNGKIFVCSVLRNESVRWSCISPRR